MIKVAEGALYGLVVLSIVTLMILGAIFFIFSGKKTRFEIG
ncbi:MAG: hypothetical protein PHX21_13225 [bacterium]|nr:hypothetical protein [bacterium]